MHTVQTRSQAAFHGAPQTVQGTAFAMRHAMSTPSPRLGEPDEGTGFNGWLASSLELKVGLAVRYLRIDPMDAEWRAVFAA